MYVEQREKDDYLLDKRLKKVYNIPIMIEQALTYFEKNPLLFADMKECILKGEAEIFYASEKGVFLRHIPSNIYMHAGAKDALCVAKEKIAGTSGWIVSHGESSATAVRETYPVLRETVCFQVVYEQNERLPDGEDVFFKKATEKELTVIVENYDKESPENLKKLQKAGKIICAFQKSDGAFVGFIGRHPEGSMGLLLIFPEFRRKGYAYHLEGKLINVILDEGRLPYAHIIDDNEQSLALQKKLGFTQANEKIVWHKIG